MVNYFLDILYQFIIINDHLHFSSYFRQSKILSDIGGRRTLRGPTDVNTEYCVKDGKFLYHLNFIQFNDILFKIYDFKAYALGREEQGRVRIAQLGLEMVFTPVISARRLLQ